MSYGDGFITVERGKYRVRIPDGKGGSISGGAYDTREEADRMRAALVEHRAALATDQTLRQYGGRWIDRYHGRPSWRTWDSVWRSVVLRAPFVDEPLSLLRPADIQAWLLELPHQRAQRSVLRAGKRVLVETDRTLSRSVQGHALGLVRRCLDAAAVDGRCDAGLCTGLQLPRPDEDPVPMDAPYLDAEDLERLLGPESPLPLEQRTVFTVAVYAGLRQGELAALRWEDVDLRRGVLHVRRSWKGPTKNRRRRTVPLIGPAREALRAWKESGSLTSGLPSLDLLDRDPGAQRAMPVPGCVEIAEVGTGVPCSPAGAVEGGRPRLTRRAGERPAPSLVFGAGERGDRLHHRGFDWGWADHPERRLTRLGWWRRCGVRRQVRFHDLRDTCATHLLSGTWGRAWSVQEVSRLLGHSSVTVTEQRYAHVLPDVLERAAAETPAANPPRGPSGGGEGGGGNAGNLEALLPERAMGFEPTTYSLGSSGSRPKPQRQFGDSGGFAASSAIGDLALALVEAVAEGVDVPEDACLALAAGCLELPALAVAVLRADPERRLQAALRLARELLPAAAGERSA